MRKKKLIREIIDDLRYLRHLGLPPNVYDEYIKLSRKYKGMLKLKRKER